MNRRRPARRGQGNMAHDGQQGDGMAELADAIANLGHGQGRFKAPRYTGDTDVELYIDQFDAVMQESHWNDHAAVLHMRERLEGPAVECGRGATTEEIRQALRARFGCTTRQAKERLTCLKRDGRKTIYEHGMMVERLVTRGYGTLAAEDRTEMAIDHFIRSCENLDLQRHMLAVPPASMTDAIRAANEFLQIGKTMRSTQPVVSAVTAQCDEPSNLLSELQACIAANTEAIAALIKGSTGTAPPRRASRGCFNCNGPHRVRDCPTAQVGREQSQTGNGDGPRD